MVFAGFCLITYLELACTNADQEEAEEELVIKYSHDPMDIGFNINYLIDVLNNTKVDDINCAVADENSSMLITIPETRVLNMLSCR